MHRLLILSRRAREYHDLVAAANLPALDITSTTDPDDAAAELRAHLPVEKTSHTRHEDVSHA